MTQTELVKELKAVTKNVAYMRFAEPQALPFIIFALPGNDDFHADDTHYFTVQNGWLELYMIEMDFVLMKQVEEVFIKNELPWSKENEDYLHKEKVFFARWNFQLI